MKDKSDIYKRFADCNLEFDLTRVSGSTVGLDSASLAKSEHADKLNDENSIVVTTNSLHGEWQNKVGSLDGWEPAWFPGAIAGIVLASFVLAFLTASTVRYVLLSVAFSNHFNNSDTVSYFLITFQLVERQLHRNLLYKVMPRRAIMKLQRGQTVLEKFNLVTIFFSDIVGFTNMAGNMRPIQVMKVSWDYDEYTYRISSLLLHLLIRLYLSLLLALDAERTLHGIGQTRRKAQCVQG